MAPTPPQDGPWRGSCQYPRDQAARTEVASQSFDESRERGPAHRIDAATREGYAFCVAASGIDDTTALVHMLHRGLRSDENSAYIHRQGSIQIFQAKVVDGRDGHDPGVVDQNVDSAQFPDRLLYNSSQSIGLGAVGLYRRRLFAQRLRGLNRFVGPICAADIGQGNMWTFVCNTLDDSSSDAGTAALLGRPCHHRGDVTAYTLAGCHQMPNRNCLRR
jgi:hypothetical protein